jgi:hypothetical protein
MLANLPVARSAGARLLFFGTAPVTVAIAWWANGLPTNGAAAGLTPIFRHLFTIFDWAGANCALLILCAAALFPATLSFRPLLRWIGEHPGRIAALSTGVLCAGALLVYRNHPLSMDEYCAVFQSQIFASGHLAGQFPAPLVDWLVPPGLQNFIAVSHATGRVTSSYWPSFALLLTPFTVLGIPWACNPILSGLTVLAAHRLALRLFNDVESAGLTVLLTIASPVFFADGISYYSMPAHLLANMVYALLLIEPTPRRAFMAGVVGSVALTLHNPVPHMLFAVPWLLWTARRPGATANFSALCAGYLPLVLAFGFGWFLFLSQLTHEGMAVSVQAASADSFQANGAMFQPPTLTLLLARVIGLAKVWVWAVPGMLILACVGGWRWRREPLCRLLIASALITLFAYILVPFDQGHGWGYRYFHPCWIVLPLFAAAALAPIRASREPLFTDAGSRTFVVACALLTLTAGVGLRAFQIHEFVSSNMRQVPSYPGTERRVVLIDAALSFYGGDLVRNDPWLRSNEIRMFAHGKAADAAMLRQYFPQMQRVAKDRYGSVWSATAVRDRAP